MKKLISVVSFFSASLVIAMIFYASVQLSKPLQTPRKPKFYDSISINTEEIEKLQQKAKEEGKPLVPPFFEFESGYVIAPKYNLTICKIKKSMSTLLSGIGCILYDSEEFMRQNRSILEMWTYRMCADRNEYYFIRDTTPTMNENSTKLAVIRDPISRFISFFIDKCIHEVQIDAGNDARCYDCKGDVQCFLEKQYERFIQHAEGKVALEKTYIDSHSIPLSWNCEFKRYMNSYKFVKMSSHPELRKEGLKQILKVLEDQNVSNKITNFIMKSATESDTEHSTFRSNATMEVKEQIAKNPAVRDYLKRIYFLDFVIFGFDYSEVF